MSNYNTLTGCLSPLSYIHVTYITNETINRFFLRTHATFTTQFNVQANNVLIYPMVKIQY